MADSNGNGRPIRRRPTVEWLSIRQYADSYGVDRRTVRKWIDNGGILVTYQIGSVVRIKNAQPSS